MLMRIKMIMGRIELRDLIVHEKLSPLRAIIRKPPQIKLGSFRRKLSNTCHIVKNTDISPS